MEGIEALMRKLYFYPVVGSFLGVLMAVGAVIAEMFFPSPMTVILIMGSIYQLTWFNHLDGVADMADGMTAHGSLEKKRKALKDTILGVGGAAGTVFALLGLFAAIYSLENAASLFAEAGAALSYPFFGLLSVTGAGLPAVMALSVIVAELSAKQAMLTIATFGKSFHEGLGSMTIDGGTHKNFTIGLFYSLIIAGLLLGASGIIALIVSVLAALYVLRTSNRHFGGLNGDGIGTSNEAGRIAAYASLALIFFTIAHGGFIWTLL